jgi:hypothetical protein
MPSLVTLPLIQCHQTSGRACRGGLAKPASSELLAVAVVGAATANAGSAPTLGRSAATEARNRIALGGSHLMRGQTLMSIEIFRILPPKFSAFYRRNGAMQNLEGHVRADTAI